MPSRSIMVQMPMKTAKTLDELLQQAYDIFDIYGKKPEQLENVMLGFLDVLAPYTDEQISEAFRTWLHNNKKFPVPAEIKEIIEEGSYSTYKVNYEQLIPEWSAELVETLGVAVVSSWFCDSTRNGDIIYTSTRFKRDWIVQNYLKHLEKIGVNHVKYCKD